MIGLQSVNVDIPAPQTYFGMAEAPTPPTSVVVYYWGPPEDIYEDYLFQIEFSPTTTVQEFKQNVQKIAKGTERIGGLSLWKVNDRCENATGSH